MPERQATRRTKIIATIGPATWAPEMIEGLVRGGMSVARINMSHGTPEQVRHIVATVRECSRRLDRPVGILMDLQGPAIRTGDLAQPLDLKVGQRVHLCVRDHQVANGTCIQVNYDRLTEDVNVNDTVLVDNGVMQMRVLARHRQSLECEVLTEGTLGSRRHINLPGVHVRLPALTDKDLRAVELGIQEDVDFFAMSFVRHADDIQRLRGIVDFHQSRQKIVAKLEDQQAVTHVEGIIRAADAVMVARGDLGIEVPYEDLPLIQHDVVRRCLQLGTPVIVATHMLESMIASPYPTRAEITDVANAVLEQADAIMLSGETTTGKYPLRCLEVMDRIARRTEERTEAAFASEAILDTPHEKIVKSACVLAEDLGARALMIFTNTGATARYAAGFRPASTPIYAFTGDARLVNQLALLWGLLPFHLELAEDDPLANVQRARELLLARGLAAHGDYVVVVSTLRSGEDVVDSVQMHVI